MTTPPTDKATLSDEQRLRSLYDECDHLEREYEMAVSCYDVPGWAQYHSKVLQNRTAIHLIERRQLRTSLAAANKRAEEADGRCEDLAAYINRINARLNDQRNNSLNLEAERDTLRTRLTEAKETMHCAVLKIQDGASHHAEGVLEDTLSRLTEANTQENKEE